MSNENKLWQILHQQANNFSNTDADLAWADTFEIENPEIAAKIIYEVESQFHGDGDIVDFDC